MRSTRLETGTGFVALAVALAFAGCATTARSPFDAPAPGEGPIRVDVDNGLTLDVGVYVMQSGGSRFRIGTISSLTRTTLRIPRGVVGPGQDIRLQAEPIGSRDRYVTQTLYLSAGSWVAWPIIPGLQASQAWVRR